MQVTGLEEVAARRNFEKARILASAVTTQAVMATEFISGGLNDMAVGNLNSDLQDYLRRLTGYEELFGNQAYCHCEHCSSVLSPAAYFVDLMHFVERKILDEVFTGALCKHVLHLRRRRPDLWTLELTCQNTDQSIPTLEIINEIFENYIAQSQRFLFSVGLGYKSDLEARSLPVDFLQEFESRCITLSDDLAIEPQGSDEWRITDNRLERTYIVNRQDEALNIYSQGYEGNLKDRAAVERVVYQQILSQFTDSCDQLAVDSFRQPFWLPLEKLHVYLEHFDRKLSTIARRLEASADVVASAALKLSPGEHRLIAEPNQDIDFLRSAYGIQFQEQDGLIEDVDDQESLVQELLDSIDLSRDELDELLQAHFINPPSLAVLATFLIRRIWQGRSGWVDESLDFVGDNIAGWQLTQTRTT